MKMTEEAKVAKRAYMKEWRAMNAEKIRNNDIRYWNKVAEDAKEEK